MSWTCPKCDRIFRRANLLHACTPFNARATSLLKDRPAALAALYLKLEKTVRGFGGVDLARHCGRRHQSAVHSAHMECAADAVRFAAAARNLKKCGSVAQVEVVTANRYALFRTTRIFADLTVMRDALRVVVHIGRKVRAPCFIKVGKSGKRVSHVALVRTARELRSIMPFLREAYDLAVSEES
jgi:hypothetical protein